MNKVFTKYYCRTVVSGAKYGPISEIKGLEFSYCGHFDHRKRLIPLSGFSCRGFTSNYSRESIILLGGRRWSGHDAVRIEGEPRKDVLIQEDGLRVGICRMQGKAGNPIWGPPVPAQSLTARHLLSFPLYRCVFLRILTYPSLFDLLSVKYLQILIPMSITCYNCYRQNSYI